MATSEELHLASARADAPAWLQARSIFGALLAAYVAVFVWLVWRSAVLQPYSDFFDWLQRYYQLQADGDLARFFWTPHNTHRLIWTLGAMLADIRLFGGQGWLLPATALAALAATAFILARVAAEAAPEQVRGFAAGLAAMLVLMASSVLDVSQPIEATYVQALVFVAGGIVLATPVQAGEGVTAARLGALACLAAAGFGNAAGLAVWPVMVLAAFRTRAAWSWRLTLIGAGGAFVALYVFGESLPPGAGGFDPQRAGLLFLDYLALPWIRAVRGLGPPLGLAMLAISGWALLRRGGPDAPRGERVACQLIAFSLATALMAALGRADQGPPSEVPLRYAVFLTPLQVGLFILALPVAARWPGRRAAVAALGLAGVLLAQQLAAGLYVVRTSDMIRRTLADFDAGQRRPEMQALVSGRLDEAAQVTARYRADGLYRTRP